jgi:hypothetical protein
MHPPNGGRIQGDTLQLYMAGRAGARGPRLPGGF